MGNRPHPYRRQDTLAFERDCDLAYADGMRELAAQRAEIIRMADESPEQAAYEDDFCPRCPIYCQTCVWDTSNCDCWAHDPDNDGTET